MIIYTSDLSTNETINTLVSIQNTLDAAVECDTLEDPANGRVVLSGTTVGSTADYSCDEGYVLTGGAQRVCQKSRTWSGVAPTCERRLFSSSVLNGFSGLVVVAMVCECIYIW